MLTDPILFYAYVEIYEIINILTISIALRYDH